jgi:2-oxoglutarate dehydrogenase complex dehydrogenase (E1) component-like enzyme
LIKSDVAKVTDSPVMHVNADDVEAVVHAIRFAATPVGRKTTASVK